MKKLLLALTCAATLVPSLTTPASAYVYYYHYHYRVWRCGNHIFWRYNYWYRY